MLRIPLLALLALLAILLHLNAYAAPGAADLSLVPVNPISGPLEAGQVVDVDIVFDATDVPVAAAQVYVDVDPAVLHIDSITEGPVFIEHGWRVLQNDFDNAAGHINVAGGRDPTAGGTDATGVTTLAQVRLRVLEDVGAMALRFSSERPRETKLVATDPVRTVTGETPDAWLGWGVCGDLTEDGVLDALDPVYGLQIINGAPATPEQLALGDVVRDGVFDVTDVAGMLQIITGQWVAWSCGPVS